MSGADGLRELTDGDREQAWALSTLAFGGDPAAPVRPAPAGLRAWGVFEGGRLVAQASCRSYAQWWGGRRVPMGGVAGVAVSPDARGRGAATRLVRALLEHLRESGQPLSALFPTSPGIYRPRGWEVVGSLDETLLPIAVLRDAAGPAGLAAEQGRAGRTDEAAVAAAVRVRSAAVDDLPELARLWQEHGRATSGALTRDGPSSPGGTAGVLGHDVVALAEQGGRATGYLAYDRGRGYGPSAQLSVHELVAGTAGAAAALVRSVGSWDAVAGTVIWRGPTDELGRLLRTPVPAPVTSKPWMLRVTDAPAAVAARGYRPEVRTTAAFTLVDPDVPGHEGPWQLTVQDGDGHLAAAPAGSPRLHVRGLALLYAGVADQSQLLRAGLLEAAVPGLDAFAGPAPVLLDYF